MLIQSRLYWLFSLCLVLVAAQQLPATPQDMAIPVVDSDQVHEFIAENRGSVVIVNFWASWCPPCIEEFPDIVQVYEERHSEGLAVIAVSMNADDEIEDIRNFLANFEPPFPIYRAATYGETFFQGVSRNWFGEMPATLIVDARGDVAHFYKRQLTYDELSTDLAALLQAARADD